MTPPLMFDFPHVSSLGQKVRKAIGGEEGKLILREFPDGETYLRVESSVKGRDVIINATLFHPNDWFLNLLFLADTLHSQGAKRINLLSPYLSYMRQDKVFHPGEALTSQTFARLLSSYFDSLITVDPHLHRYRSLDEIYTIPSTVLQAAPLISRWIHKNVENPFLVGPDEESAQWVQAIAGDTPFIVLHKTRYEDGHVKINWLPVGEIEGKTPVFVDDIISSGGTLLQAAEHLKTLTPAPPWAVAIHPIFAWDSYEKLKVAGFKNIATCNSIPHPSNQIDLSELIVGALEK